MFIEMSDFSITLRRKRIKNINLRIDRSGQVTVSAPFKTPLDVIQSFLQQKSAWIEKHRSRLQQVRQSEPQSLITGEYIFLHGIPYALHLFTNQTHQSIQLHENQIHFYVKPNISQAQKEVLLTKWYRMQMEALLPALLDKWQTTMKVHIHQISIRRMKSRWGSCHPRKKHITLNLRLIEKPLICLEYVIVHELVHLFEPSHNQRFYALMSHYLPDWKQIRKQLR